MIDLRMLIVGIFVGAAIVVYLLSRFDKEGGSGCFYILIVLGLLIPALLLVILPS